MRPSHADLRPADDAWTSQIFGLVNDRIRQLAAPFPSDRARDFICECDDPSCLEIVRLTPAEYDVICAGRHASVLALHHRRLRAAGGGSTAG
jgi:hypothetical protein